MTSSDIVPAPLDLATAEDPWAELMTYAETLETEDKEQVLERILRSILSANSPSEVLAAGAAIKAASLDGVPITVRGIHPADSTFAEGPEKYLHVDATIITNGDNVTFSTSARDVVAKVLYLSMRGWLPFDAVLRVSKRATAEGYFPMFLQDLGPDDLKMIERGKAKPKPTPLEGDEKF